MMTKDLAIEKDMREWTEYFSSIGEKSYRAKQISAWIWKRYRFDPSEMTDFSKSLRERIASDLDFFCPEIVHEEVSRDGTRKFLIRMSDGVEIEAALLKMGDRLTACISSQAGCPIGCPFCSTGASGFERNLTKGEIAGQSIAIERHISKQVSSIVLMGMGEPLLNYDAVMGAVSMLNDKDMRELGRRHITLSTSGIVPGIDRLAASGSGIRLAVSLHAADDELRDELVPCNTTYPLRDLMEALRRYQESTGDRITIEWSLFKDKNDSVSHARRLVSLLRGSHVYINLIPGNPTGEYKTSPHENIFRFESVLKTAGFETEIRQSKGQDINAACGQLRLALSR